jgi:hypothetical protein
MFEYNFGDSEIKMLFLILITVPYAWQKTIQANQAVEQEPSSHEWMAAEAHS